MSSRAAVLNSKEPDEKRVRICRSDFAITLILSGMVGVMLGYAWAAFAYGALPL